MLTVISYYSIRTPYVDEHQRMVESADRHGLRVVAVPFVDRGDWYRNTAYKAEMIRWARDTISGPLLYVDADAVFHGDPTPYMRGLATRYDFAAHYFNGPTVDSEMLSGTMWLADTQAAHEMIDRWVAENRKLQAAGQWVGGGQLNLANVVESFDGLRVHKLPGRFCYIFDKPWAYPEGEPRVIEHLQASRENRDRRGRVNEPRRQRIKELQGAA